MAKQQLHMTLYFRSHDAYGAHALNLAGACIWLVEWARALDMDVGTLTCISGSAHVYGKDWAKAEETAKKHRPRGIAWDQRSSWRVEKFWPDVAGWRCPKCSVGLEAGQKLHRCADSDPEDHSYEARPMLRAVALTPDGNSVVAVFERETPKHLLMAIERSGLCTSVQSAFWLVQEVERVWRS